jgi:DNA-binding transcriptional ArsR family regulator
MEMIFRALADRSRRRLLDRLFASDGLTLGQLCDGICMSRQAVSKHLRILEEAGLVVVDWQGREKRHYLNPVPISEIGDRWIEKFARKRAAAVVALKNALEEDSSEGS